MLTLTGTNSFSGVTTIVLGTIRAGSSAAIGTNATLAVNGSVSNTVFASADATSLTFAKSVSTNVGGGGITFGDATGTGDLTFTGNLARATGTTARNVNVAGTTTVTFNGNLTSPGSNSTTTFTKGGTGTLVIRGTDYDAVNVSGALTGTNAIFRVVLDGAQNFSETFWDTTRTWSDIFKDGDAGSDLSFASIFTGTTQYYNVTSGALTGIPATQGYFTLSGSNLTWSPIPEPSSALLSGLLIGAGLLRRRRSA